MASKYQQRVIQQLERWGFLVVKTIRLNKSGFGDLIAIKDGKTIFIECKEVKDTVSALQLYRGREVEKYGAKFILSQDGKENDITKWDLLRFTS
jgi:Holliday junction resolvase